MVEAQNHLNSLCAFFVSFVRFVLICSEKELIYAEELYHKDHKAHKVPTKKMMDTCNWLTKPTEISEEPKCCYHDARVRI